MTKARFTMVAVTLALSVGALAPAPAVAASYRPDAWIKL